MRKLLVLYIAALACGGSVMGDTLRRAADAPVEASSITYTQEQGTRHTTPEDRRLVLIYVHHPLVDTALHGHMACSPDAVLPLPRWVPSADTPLRDTLELLIRGALTDDERAVGFSTGFPLPGLVIESLTLVDRTLTIAFSDPQYSTTGGTCRVTLLWAQIEKTALQFTGIDHVVHDPADLFQP